MEHEYELTLGPSLVVLGCFWKGPDCHQVHCPGVPGKCGSLLGLCAAFWPWAEIQYFLSSSQASVFVFLTSAFAFTGSDLGGVCTSPQIVGGSQQVRYWERDPIGMGRKQKIRQYLIQRRTLDDAA